LLKFSPTEFAVVAEGLREGIAERKYTCYAAAVMPEHVHLLIRKHRDKAEEMIAHLQRISRLHIMRARLRDTTHPVWTTGGHRGFIDNPERLRATIQYIERNPIKESLPAQHWPFVVEYDGWALHPGHDPDSP
jgi:REP element-mobilizing transposase RayT